MRTCEHTLATSKPLDLYFFYIAMRHAFTHGPHAVSVTTSVCAYRDEGGTDGGIVVQDCLEMMNNLLRGNNKNQLLFK